MGRIEPIGEFQPFAELARRPATIVYKAYQPTLERFVLLKVLRPEVARDEDLAGQFEAEARLLARIQHPNVVAIYACGRHGEHLYLAAEYVEGTDLAALLAHGPLPPALALYVAREATRGLHAAHEQGILHRDLKPANILIALDGQVKLSDFGMASLASEDAGAEVRGTPAYLAPEQILGAPPTEAADLFALGATLFEMLTGRPAFIGPDTGAVFDALLHHDPTPALAGLPDALAAVCRRLLARDPAERFAGAEEVLAALDAAARIEGLHADADALAAYVADPTAPPALPPPPAAPTTEALPPPPTEARRRPLPLRLALGAAVLLLAGVAGAFLLREVLEPPASDGAGAQTTHLATDSAASSQAASPKPFRDSLETAAPSSRTGPAAPDEPVAENTSSPLREEPASSVAPGTEAPVAGGATGTARQADVPPSMPLAPAGLHVVSEPWAVVYLDGDSAGVTPLLLDSLPPGPHRLTLRHPEIAAFPAHEQTVDLRPGETRTVSVPLWDHVGRLVLIVSPWAEVYLDDTYRDTVPPQRQPLIVPPGPHTLTLKHPQLGTWSTPIHVAPGRIDTLRFPLPTLLRQ